LDWRGKGKLEEGECGPSDAFDQTFFAEGGPGGGSARSTIGTPGWWGTRADPPLRQRLSSFLALAAGAGASKSPLSCVSFPQVVGELPERKPPPEYCVPSRHRSFPARIWRRDYIIACTQHRDAILKTATRCRTPGPHLLGHVAISICWTLIPLPTRPHARHQ
jgi:hypothetical protein